jgi:hypothetical protein
MKRPLLHTYGFDGTDIAIRADLIEGILEVSESDGNFDEGVRTSIYLIHGDEDNYYGSTEDYASVLEKWEAALKELE